MSSKDTEIPEIEYIRKKLDMVNTQIVDLLYDRTLLVDQISLLKTKNGLGSYQPGRFQAMMTELYKQAQSKGLDKDLVRDVFNVIHEHSIEQQDKVASADSGVK